MCLPEAYDQMNGGNSPREISTVLSRTQDRRRNFMIIVKKYINLYFEMKPYGADENENASDDEVFNIIMGFNVEEDELDLLEREWESFAPVAMIYWTLCFIKAFPTSESAIAYHHYQYVLENENN